MRLQGYSKQQAARASAGFADVQTVPEHVLLLHDHTRCSKGLSCPCGKSGRLKQAPE